MFASKKRYVIYGSTRSSAPLVLDEHFLSERDAGKVYGAPHQRAENLWIYASHSGVRKSDGSIDVSFIDRCMDGSVGCAGIKKTIAGHK